MAGAWVGNVLLTIIAFVLAFMHPDKLSPLTFIAAAFAILSGNLLPLAVYIIELLYHQAEVKAENAKAGDTLRRVAARIEQLEARLQETSEAASKSILIARQVPDRIDEKLKGFQAFVELAQEGGLKDLLGQIGNRSSAPAAPAADPAQLKALEAKVDAVLQRLEQMPATAVAAAPVETPVEAPKPAPISPVAPAKAESKPRRLGRGLDRLISKGVAGSAAAKPKPMPPLEPAPAPEAAPEPKPEPELTLEPAEELESIDDGLEELDDIESPLGRQRASAQPELSELAEEEAELEAEAETVEAAEEEEADEDQNWLDDDELAALEDDFAGEVSVEEEETPASEEPAASDFEKPTPVVASAADEALTFDDDELSWDEEGFDFTHGQEAPAVTNKQKSTVVVRAMVGNDHTITLRGAAPLREEVGLPLPMTGVGEYRWEVELDEPVLFQVYLDDQVQAAGEVQLLEPGQTLRLMPRFPR